MIDFGPPIKKEKPPFTFGKFPDWIVKSGALILMNKGDLKLLCYLCCVTYMKTGNSTVSWGTL